MSSEASKPDLPNELPSSKADDQIEIIDQLTKDFKDLTEKAQQLLTEKLFLENEHNQLKKRVNRLEEELGHIKTPPLVIGHIQDIVDEQAVVRSSNGTVFLVSVNMRLDSTLLKPGARVALNQDSLSIVEVLSDSWDPLVSGSEIIDSPSVSFHSIGGLDDQVKELRQTIELPLEKPEEFTRFGIEPPKGVLLTGPPGTGKTMLAKAVASSTNATFLGLVGSELAQKYIGEGGRMVRELFDLARQKSPSIIFIDELDSIGSRRLDTATSGDREVQRTLMQLLSEMDGFEPIGDVKVIAATNRPELLDPALLRPGRFDRIIEIPIPDLSSREAIIAVHVENMPLSKDVNLKKIAAITEGFSGAEIRSAAIEAAIASISNGQRNTSNKHFIEAVQKIKSNRGQNDGSQSQGLYS